MNYKPDILQISDTPESLYNHVAEDICLYASGAIKKKGIFNVVLAGGSTPEQLYSTLSSAPFRDNIPWQHCHFYFGDERFVAHDHTDSNYRMARQALFDHVTLPDINIHPIPTDCIDADVCAERYAQTISQIELFDLILLGIGDDGHTASLFPGTTILQEKEKTVAAVYVKKMDSWRISLTYPALNKARRVMVLVKGDSKQPIVENVLYGDHPSQYPITHVRPTGELIWQLDRNAHPRDLTV